MTSQFQNYVPVQGLAIADTGFIKVQESVSESPIFFSPNVTSSESVSASPQVTVT